MNCKLCGGDLELIRTEEKHTLKEVIEIGVYNCEGCGRIFRYPVGDGQP